MEGAPCLAIVLAGMLGLQLLVKSLGDKLRELLLEHGNLGAVELVVQKWESQLDESSLEGGWHNEITLKAKNWTA